jgi:predicted DNA-binding transcriptional regulator YafY
MMNSTVSRGETEPAERKEEQAKRVTRLLRIISLIANEPRRWTRRALAEEFEVSERQIDDDLQVLRHGLRYGLQHTPRGYYFSDTPALRAIHYTVPEALALLTALQVARSEGAIDQTTLASALVRTEDALPEHFRPLIERLHRMGDERSRQAGHRAAMLAMVQTALATRCCLAVTYDSASGGARERVLQPYDLTPEEGGFLLVAHDSVHGEVRYFRIDRILEARQLAERYEIPPDFDARAYRGSGWGVLRGMARPPERIVLRFNAEEGRRVRDEQHHPSQRETKQADGSWLISFHAGITPELVRWVFRWGTGCVVLEPAALRAMVRAQAAAIAALYGE